MHDILNCELAFKKDQGYITSTSGYFKHFSCTRTMQRCSQRNVAGEHLEGGVEEGFRVATIFRPFVHVYAAMFPLAPHHRPQRHRLGSRSPGTFCALHFLWSLAPVSRPAAGGPRQPAYPSRTFARRVWCTIAAAVELGPLLFVHMCTSRKLPKLRRGRVCVKDKTTGAVRALTYEIGSQKLEVAPPRRYSMRT
jgi:hypothetical protein